MKEKFNKPHLLLFFQALQGRKFFSPQEHSTFQRLKSGYQGERSWYEHVKNNLAIGQHTLFDLTFNIGGNEVQIDSLIITESRLYHLEIKNYSGSTYIR